MSELNNEELDKVNGGISDPKHPNLKYYIYDCVASHYIMVSGPYNTWDEAKAALDAMISNNPSLKDKRKISKGLRTP